MASSAAAPDEMDVDEPGEAPTSVAEALRSLGANIQRVCTAAARPEFSFPLAERQAETPKTLGECYTTAQNAANEKETKKKKNDQAGLSNAPVGGEYLSGAFPNVREAPFMAWSEEYFRPLRSEEVQQVLAMQMSDPAEDPIFRAPPLGRPYLTAWAEEDANAAIAAAARDGEGIKRRAAMKRSAAVAGRAPKANSNAPLRLAQQARARIMPPVSQRTALFF